MRCELDTPQYPSGIVVSDEQMAAINIKRSTFHGDWNYTISPNTYPPNRAFLSGRYLSRRSRIHRLPATVSLMLRFWVENYMQRRDFIALLGGFLLAVPRSRAAEGDDRGWLPR